MTQGLRPTREGVPDICLADGQNESAVEGYPLRSLWCQRCAADALDFRKVEPQMPAVIVLAEHDFSIGAGNGVAELVAIAALLKNGSGDPEIGDTACDRGAEEHARPLLSAQAAEPSGRHHRHGPDPREMRSCERTEAFVFVEREQPPSCVGGEQQATMAIANPPKRAGPLTVG